MQYLVKSTVSFYSFYFLCSCICDLFLLFFSFSLLFFFTSLTLFCLVIHSFYHNFFITLFFLFLSSFFFRSFFFHSLFFLAFTSFLPCLFYFVIHSFHLFIFLFCYLFFLESCLWHGIWWWDFSCGDLGIIESFLHCHYSQISSDMEL